MEKVELIINEVLGGENLLNVGKSCGKPQNGHHNTSKTENGSDMKNSVQANEVSTSSTLDESKNDCNGHDTAKVRNSYIIFSCHIFCT